MLKISRISTIGFTVYILETLWNWIEIVLVSKKIYYFGVIQQAIFLFTIIIFAGILTIKATEFKNKRRIIIEIVLASLLAASLQIFFGALELLDWRFGFLSSINTLVTTNIKKNNYLNILSYFFVRSLLYTIFLSLGAIFRVIIVSFKRNVIG